MANGEQFRVFAARAERASTLIVSQSGPVADWHVVIGDPSQADAICDRLLHDARRIELKGHSMGCTHDAPKTPSTWALPVFLAEGGLVTDAQVAGRSAQPAPADRSRQRPPIVRVAC